MADTFVKIASVTVGSGGAASIDFTSIPSTYTDLYLFHSNRLQAAVGGDEETWLRFNGDTGSNYVRIAVYGYGAGVTGSNSVTSNYLKAMGQTPGTLATANTFDNAAIYIPNYAGSTQKSVSCDGVSENNSTTSWGMQLTAGRWTGTSAITSISLFPSTGAGFVQYSTATLYGILKA
jgi:hypothetical protein